MILMCYIKNIYKNILIYFLLKTFLKDTMYSVLLNTHLVLMVFFFSPIRYSSDFRLLE